MEPHILDSCVALRLVIIRDIFITLNFILEWLWVPQGFHTYEAFSSLLWEVAIQYAQS